MISNVAYVTPNINKQIWEIGDDIGHNFEDYIFKVLVRCTKATFTSKINIKQTESTRDGGKDIVIDSSTDLDLFGIHFSLKGKEKIRIYVECKSSNHDTIVYDKFAKNVILAGQDKVDYLVLVTNKTIVPFAYYSTYEFTREHGCEFVLIDQYLLANFLNENNLNKWNYICPQFDKTQIALSYQVEKGNYYQKPSFELYIFCRNYSSKISECEFSLLTDRNWSIPNNKIDFVLDANKSKCIKIIIYREYFDGFDDVLLQLCMNKRTNIIELEGTSLSYNFELPLTGIIHKNILSNIKETLSSTASFCWINLYGEAGIGKTRIIEELSKDLWQNSSKFYSYVCGEKKKQTTFESLLLFINKKLHKNINTTNLKDLFYTLNDEFLPTIFIIEDIHNADEEFINMLCELKEEKNLKPPVLLITAGRDDYTVYNENYFSFLESLKVSVPVYMHNYKVTSLKDDECKRLIKRIITEIPTEALNKIHKASNNNPFFLVQFIEYLLETKLVNLLNRNTVGIPNIQTFCEKIYIPEGVEDILNRRFTTLAQFPLKYKLQDFLLSAALYGISFPKKLLLNFFSEDEYQYVEVLFMNHFLKIVDKETLQFDHETLYLYIRGKKLKALDKKRIFQNLYANNDIFEIYHVFKQGVILVNINKISKAKNKLQEPIEEILAMDNISSENISPDYYEYFDYIYIIAKKEKNIEFMKKVILAKIYVAMHNLAIGRAQEAFESTFALIEKNHKGDEELKFEVKQLQSSYFLHTGMISKARGIMFDLLAAERVSPEKFKEQLRFNLFERAASLYIHTNHFKPAMEYNKLAFKVANEMNNDKLRALAKINEAKLWFFSDINKSYFIMQEANDYLLNNNVSRIKCHNDLGLLTTEMVMTKCNKNVINEQIKKAQELLEKSIEVNYPLDIIRAYFLLAVLYFMTENKNIKLSKKCIEAGIDSSIRYGILKLMGNFYNLKALIAIYENENKEYIVSLYETMLDYLKQEDLLFIGNLDFTYSNIILLTNYLIFANKYELESKIYELFSKITYYGSDIKCDFKCKSHTQCHYTCYNNTEIFKKNLKKIKDGSLLLVNHHYKFTLKSGIYFIPIYL